MKKFWLSVLLILFPASVDAAVFFTEIAWMGSTESANHEWIELYNSGSAVSVDGWIITDNNNLEINLTGTVPANSYVVLERSSDDTAPGGAFLVYTGSLVNTGATLQLLRSNGAIEDQVSGGEDWQNLGGDNATKDTAQYTNSGWVTGAPSLGRGLQQITTSSVTEEDDEEESLTTETSINRRSSNQGPATILTLPDVTLELDIEGREIGYVNQTIKFEVEASGVGDTIIDSLTYEWSFGDGNYSLQKQPQHVFRYPGTYVVTAYASYKRQEQATRHEITILPVTVSLTTNRQGDIQINNDSKYEIDLSDYRIVGAHSFTFPPRTIILPNQTITLNKTKVGSSDSNLVMIYDTEGVALSMLSPVETARVIQERLVIDNSPAPMISATAVSRPVPITETHVSEQFTFATPERVEIESQLPLVANERELLDQKASVVNSSSTPISNWPYLALIGLLILAILGALFTTKRN